MSSPKVENQVDTAKTGGSRHLGPVLSFSDVLEGLMNQDLNGRETPWARPTIPCLNEDEKSIVFQKIDIRESNQESGRSEIHLFGVTKAGNSILVRILNFEYYFFYPAPDGITEEDTRPLREYLNTLLNAENPVITSIDLESQGIPSRGEPLAFLKISLSDHRELRRVKGILASGKCEYRDLFTSPEVTYETTVPYFLRFMLDYEVKAMTWLKIPTRKYTLVKEEEKISFCQVEVYVHEEHLLICDTVGDRENFAPLRILSFDIECHVPSVDGEFSNAKRDAIIQIGSMVSLYGQEDPFIRNIFTLGSCSPITGSQVLSFTNESDMLMAWRKFFLEVDPDVVIGYNITQFDIPYLLNRSRVLGLREFPFLGRVRSLPQRLTKRQPHFLECPGYDGRLLLDVYHYIRENHPGLPGEGAYKLNGVAAHFLGEHKEDISYRQIPILQGGDADTRRELALYCLKDAYLPLLLSATLRCFEKEVKDASSSHVPYNVMRVWRPLKDIAKRCLDAIAHGYVVADTT